MMQAEPLACGMVRRARTNGMECPVARAMDAIGDWWSILILRDLSLGLSRFDELTASLGVAPNMLTRRLAALIEAGLVERQPYSARPPRYDYRLTEGGRDFEPVLTMLYAWGQRHFGGDCGATVELVDRVTGRPLDPVVVDRATHRPIDRTTARIVPGPAAGAEVTRRMALLRAARARGRPDAIPSEETSP
jgi:DNA-binding HxlR family transcriptional regulator